MQRKQIVVILFYFVFASPIFAHVLKFHAYGKADGLSDMFVLHITQMKDGGIAVTSGKHVDIIRPDGVKSYAKDYSSAMALKGYQGAYHAYVDKEGHLWVKNAKRVWCYDAQMKPLTHCVPDSCDDLFVDNQGSVHFLKQQPPTYLLDWVTMKGLTYEFRNNGIMTCKEGERKLYDIALPLDSMAKTSLVVCDTIHHRLYQLLDGRLCIEYDVKAKTWTEIFRSELLYTISIIDSQTAYIVSKNGLWSIHLPSRKVEKIAQVQLDDGSFISSSRINSVFVDGNGRVWLGTFDHGVLKSCKDQPLDPLWIGLAVVATLGIAFVIALRVRRNLRKKSSKPIVNSQVPIDSAFVARVRQTIEQNLTTPNYTVERLAHELCMERTGLYKKLVAMTGLTPTTFIRKIKIERATALIRSGEYTMTQVAELTGFSSASYMAKCFQEEKGKKPSEMKDFNDSVPLNQPD